MAYQVWIENDAYTKQAILKVYRRLRYVQRLNGIGFCEIEMHPDDSKIASIDIMNRVKIIRDGVIVFGGLILRAGWQIPQTAPEGETYKLFAQDHAVYAQWRICLPASGSAYEEEGPDDSADVMKDFIKGNLGSGAAAARQFSDLTIAADNHDGDSITHRERYTNVMTALQKLAQMDDLDFWFTPTASGCTFDAKALWGDDRSMGNGVNDECVFSKDRHNFLEMSWSKDALTHANFLYLGGQGEGANREIVERSTAGDITTYKRREKFVDARQLVEPTTLQARGDAALTEMQVIESMNVKPTTATWKAASGTTWDLGDVVTVYAREHAGHSLSYDGKVVAIDVRISPEGEVVTPLLEMYS